MKSSLLRLSRSLGLGHLLRRLNRDKPVILTYHGFTDRVFDDRSGELLQHLHMRADAFEAQLRLVSRYYHVVPLADVVLHCEGRKELPANALAITIDDGYRGVYDYAFPLLAKYQQPATVFLATDFVEVRQFLWNDRMAYCVEHTERARLDVGVGTETLSLDLSTPEAKRAGNSRLLAATKTLSREERNAVLRELEKETGRFLGESAPVAATCHSLSWVQVKEMAASGLIAFGSHTRTHAILSHCTPGELLEELASSKAIIEERTGTACELFCYPNGTAADFSETTRAGIVDAGYRCALTTVPGLVGPEADAYALPRFSSNATLPNLELKLAGAADLHKLLPI